MYTVGSGKNQRTYTAFKIKTTNRYSYSFRLYKEGFFSKIGKGLGMQDIQIEDEEFDKNYIIKSNDDYFMKTLLEDALKSHFLQLYDKMKGEFNGDPLDVTDDAASGWQSLAAVHGLKSLEMSFSGPLKNLELVGLYFGASQAVSIVWTFPDGGTTVTVDGVLSALSVSGDSNTPYSWDASFASSGAAVYVAAT